MIRQWLAQNADPETQTILAALATLFFLSVFIGAWAMVISKGKDAYKKHGELPLNDD